MKIFLLIIISLLFNTCINQEEGFSTKSIFPEEFQVVSQTENRIKLRMVIFCGSACWININDRISSEGNVYRIQTFASTEARVCSDNCVSYTRNFEIVVPTGGEYIFEYIHRGTVAKSISVII